MLNLLRTHDVQMAELKCGCGSVLIPPSLQGRIFCEMDGELVHRLDENALLAPSPNEYNNAGGNSLWPAPEGGPFAFNYLPGSDEWVVQEGIGRTVPRVSCNGDGCAVVEKRIDLINRKGVEVHVGYRRLVSVPNRMVVPKGYAIDGLAYRTEDILEPLGEYSTDDVLMAPWSLEQFPGADGVLAFGKVADGPDPLNCDFYGSPEGRLARRPGLFAFHLGGQDRHQIGVKINSHPHLIGSLDIDRSLLILRKTIAQDGLYFNIADNEQRNGPFSAADLYSIFNGGSLGFFELETIGAMRVIDDRVAVSLLPSQTVILRGEVEELLRYLSEREGLDLAEFVPSTGAKTGGAGQKEVSRI